MTSLIILPGSDIARIERQPEQCSDYRMAGVAVEPTIIPMPLVLAAPDLLAACKKLLWCVEIREQADDATEAQHRAFARDEARAAIARAMGGVA